jgi:APA family basic amino acid/polyamine antiporter
MPAEFGMATAVYVIVASMVGVGVLTTSGFTVAQVGSNQLMLGLWVVGGVLALCGALALAELAAALPRSGGDYVFLSEAYGPLPAFLSGWVSFLIGFAAPIAVAADASASYLLSPLGLTEPTRTSVQRSVATGVILAFALIHVSGRARTIRVQGVVTLLKLSILVVYAVAGLTLGAPNLANLDDRLPLDSPRLLNMLFSLVYISYAYTGWNAAAYLAGEIDNPQRRLPRAILLGTVGVTLLYLALNLVYALALPAAEVQQMASRNQIDSLKRIAEVAGERLFGAGVARVFGVAIGLMLLSTLSAYVLTGPRVLYAMAGAGQFPAIAGRLSTRTETPVVATALQVAWALLLLWTGQFNEILIYAGVGLALFSMLTVSSVYALRRRRPDLPRPFRTPGYPWTPAIYLAGTAALTAAAFIKDDPQARRASLLALASIAAGVPIYYLWMWLRGRSRPAASPSLPA